MRHCLLLVTFILMGALGSTQIAAAAPDMARPVSASPQDALQALGATLAGDPGRADARLARAKLLASLGRHWDAIRDLNVLVVRGPNSPTVLTLRGTSLLALGYAEQAISDFTGALVATPYDVAALSGRAAAFAKAGDDALALADYDALLAAVGGQPGDAIDADRLAKVRQERALVMGRLKQAQVSPDHGALARLPTRR